MLTKKQRTLHSEDIINAYYIKFQPGDPIRLQDWERVNIIWQELPKVAQELGKLRKENEELRREVNFGRFCETQK